METTVNQDIQQHILALHARLDRLDRDAIDSGTRESLMLLLNDLTRLLGAASLDNEDHPLTDRLEQLAVNFEAEHPAVGTAVRQLIDALAKAGI
jgi:phosphoenolpyruvate synthase/pyruvate phosphate dikinase